MTTSPDGVGLDLDDAARRYRFALAPEDFERLPFYRALADELEHDELALRLLASVRVEQRNPMLVLAALHLAALRGHEALAPLYDAARHETLADPRGAARRVVGVLRDDPSIVSDELWRSTQTNEPGRGAVLQAVVSDLGAGAEVINVIDVGTSAGINLRFDQFTVAPFDDGSPLTLVCEDNVPTRRATGLPITQRIGIDPHPLSLAREDDRLWLKACLWAEERRRHERFDAIVANEPHWPAITVLTGSATERLDEALSLCDESALTIVMNTWVAAYLSSEEREWYFRRVARASATANVAWISIESPLVTWPGIDLGSESARHRSASLVVVSRPGTAPVQWGWCHAHGRWLERI